MDPAGGPVGAEGGFPLTFALSLAGPETAAHAEMPPSRTSPWSGLLPRFLFPHFD